MDAQTNRRLAELERRLANVLRLGTIVAVDYPAARASVRIGELLPVNLPFLSQRAGPDSSWWAPEAGEQVMVLSPAGELEHGVVLPAIYSTAHPAPAASPDIFKQAFADGTTITNNRATNELHIEASGQLFLRSAGGLWLDAAHLHVFERGPA